MSFLFSLIFLTWVSFRPTIDRPPSRLSNSTLYSSFTHMRLLPLPSFFPLTLSFSPSSSPLPSSPSSFLIPSLDGFLLNLHKAIKQTHTHTPAHHFQPASLLSVTNSQTSRCNTRYVLLYSSFCYSVGVACALLTLHPFQNFSFSVCH